MVSHPDDLIIGSISSGWHNGIWTLSHPDELAPGRISSGWLLDTAVCHPDDISYHRMSSGWLSGNWYLMRMSYDNVIMSSGWHRLPFLSHPDEIANLDFPHHAVALQRFRINGPLTRYVTSRVMHVRGMPVTFPHHRRGNRSRYPSACATHNFTYLARGPYFPRHSPRRMLWNLHDWCYVDIGSYNGLGRQAINDYLNQCWPISPTPYGVTKPQRLLVYDILSQWNLQKLFTRNFSLPNWSIEYFASAHIHLPRVSLSTGFLLKKHGLDKLVRASSIRDLHNKDGCCGAWINHVPAVWWSTFRFRFLIVSWCESLVWWVGFSIDFLPLFMFYTLPKFLPHFPSQINLLSDRFFYLVHVLCAGITIDTVSTLPNCIFCIFSSFIFIL